MHTSNSASQFLSLFKLPNSLDIQGISGGTMKCTHGGRISWNGLEGTFPDLGTALFILNSLFNLLSVGELMKRGVDFIGNSKNLTMEMLITVNGVVYHNISHMTEHLNIFVAKLTNGLLFTVKATSVLLPTVMESTSAPTALRRNYTKHERSRAESARNFHDNLLHPGFDSLMDGAKLNLTNGITVNDFLMCLELYGRCIPCLQAKMKHETRVETHSAKPTHIGQFLSCDLKNIKTEETQEMFFVDVVWTLPLSGRIYERLIGV